MSRNVRRRLADIGDACDTILGYAAADPELLGVTFDAIYLRLIVIEEAVKDLDAQTRALALEIPWRGIAAMRDRAAHRYFDTAHSIVARTIQDDIPVLRGAVQRMLNTLG